jgi:hypothetical protein
MSDVASLSRNAAMENTVYEEEGQDIERAQSGPSDAPQTPPPPNNTVSGDS